MRARAQTYFINIFKRYNDLVIISIKHQEANELGELTNLKL